MQAYAPKENGLPAKEAKLKLGPTLTMSEATPFFTYTTTNWRK